MTKDLPDLTIGFGLVDQILDSASAPNTIAVLEGSDPKLKNEYVVFSATWIMWERPAGGQCQARGGDTICNGADDDGSGTVSVMELARPSVRRASAPSGQSCS